MIEAIRCGLSFLWVRVRPPKDQTTLEGYVVANYGWRLYGHFFKAYSTKVWAVPPSEISAEWGAQRIKGMTLWSAVWEPHPGALRGQAGQGPAGHQPDRGVPVPEARARDDVGAVPGARRGARARRWCSTRRSPRSTTRAGAPPSVVAGGSTYDADHVISSMPFNGLLRAMDPPVPDEVRQAADDLVFRDFLSVALVVPAEKVAWTDNWIYIHDPEIKTMRVQNFGSWSPYMVKDGRNVLGLEYTVNEGDEWWTASDDELIERGKAELEALGLMRAADVETGYVVRMPKAYPVYDETYQQNVGVLRTLAGGQHPQRAPHRTQRDAPLQQPGPLDVHGACSPSTTSTAPTTTSGTSTSRRSTTRSRRATRQAPAARAATPR